MTLCREKYLKEWWNVRKQEEDHCYSTTWRTRMAGEEQMQEMAKCREDWRCRYTEPVQRLSNWRSLMNGPLQCQACRYRPSHKTYNHLWAGSVLCCLVTVAHVCVWTTCPLSLCEVDWYGGAGLTSWSQIRLCTSPRTLGFIWWCKFDPSVTIFYRAFNYDRPRCC